MCVQYRFMRFREEKTLMEHQKRRDCQNMDHHVLISYGAAAICDEIFDLEV